MRNASGQQRENERRLKKGERKTEKSKQEHIHICSINL